MFVVFDATNLGQLLEHTPFFFAFQVLLELTLFVAETLGFLRHPRRRHMQQDVGAVHPVNVGLHRVKTLRGHILKTEMLLDIFMKKLNIPLRRPL